MKHLLLKRHIFPSGGDGNQTRAESTVNTGLTFIKWPETREKKKKKKKKDFPCNCLPTCLPLQLSDVIILYMTAVFHCLDSKNMQGIMPDEVSIIRS